MRPSWKINCPLNGDRACRCFYFYPSIMVVAILYLILAGAYLLVIPVALLFYLQQRWYVASSFERSFMYFMVFFFFPGLLVLAPFVNFRTRRRQIQG